MIRDFVGQINVLWAPNHNFQHPKLFLCNSYSFTFSPYSGIFSTLATQSMQWTAIISFLLMPKTLQLVYLCKIQVSDLWDAPVPWLPGSFCLCSPLDRYWKRTFRCKLPVWLHIFMLTLHHDREQETANCYKTFIALLFNYLPDCLCSYACVYMCIYSPKHKWKSESILWRKIYSLQLPCWFWGWNSVLAAFTFIPF